MIYYEDLMWVNYYPSETRPSWVLAANYYQVEFNKLQPKFSSEDFVTEYDNSTGTLTILYSRFLPCHANAEMNALQMRKGERWVVGFPLELGFQNVNGQDYVDGWPKKIYHGLSPDSSWWPKLVIDLTNPPPTIPGQNPA